MFNITLNRLLIASAVFSLFGLGLISESNSNIYIKTNSDTVIISETITIDIMVKSDVPTNVFKGMLMFDPTTLSIKTIDYNTSVADLWAEEPWYNNGAGTLSFTGGTTRIGGFTGDDRLLKVTFQPLNTGKTTLAMRDIRILRHDGLGSDVAIQTPIDTIFNITPNNITPTTILQKEIGNNSIVQILAEAPNFDLNADGKKSIADTSIFMIHFATQNLRSDFNQDGIVNLKDFSILNNG